ncbi:MAG: C/D box methylation guide ribonucleoprotein complex aNOP56 subunit [Candidatus Hermodarchaeota archaeon]
MKCYITDTLVGIFAFDETGTTVNFIDFENDDQKTIEFFQSLESEEIKKEYEDFLFELKNTGFDEFVFDNKQLESLTSEKLGYTTMLEPNSLEFKNYRFNLEDHLRNIGLSLSKEQILEKFKRVNEQLIKRKVSQAGEQSDTIIMQIIETTDLLKKSISLFSNRLREWYGLHFPELTDKLIEDNIQLAKLIKILGNRENYTSTNLNQNFEYSENLTDILVKKASESMGANFDLKIVQDYGDQILSLDAYRDELEIYLEELMEKTAPNLNAIVGALIGAKLIAKAGSLKKLAYMPASRIQLLGAEKALYRFLKTGEKRPKHGLIFQWRQIRGSKPWLRGKISRTIAGKIGLASKIDYFGGEYMGDILLKDIEEKIKEIELKYPNPPKKKTEPKRPVKKGKGYKKKKQRR